MLKNYFIVSFRNLRRNLSYSLVNVFGLTVGLACTLVIGLWVYQEYSYDRHFDDHEKVFRIGVNFFNVGDMAVGPKMLKEKLSGYADVKYVVGLDPIGSRTLIIDNEEYVAERVFASDPAFFDVFSYPFISGERSTSLGEPRNMVLTSRMARQLFGSVDVIGKTVFIKDEDRPYTITGVVDASASSHIASDLWISHETSTPPTSWTSASSYIYAVINHSDAEKRLAEMLNDQLEEIRTLLAPNETFEAFQQSGMYIFHPMAIADIHLKSQLKFEPSPTGNGTNVHVFAGVAVLILLLASINFINISTARSTSRAREVGIRKSLGSHRAQLIVQFVLEAVVICWLSVSMAIVLGEFFLGLFEHLTGLELLETVWVNVQQIVVVYLGATLLGVIAGIYPAIYITRFEAVRVLKGNVDVQEKGILRNSLVLFQFFISMVLLVVAMFVFQQLRFLQTKDMGFDVDNVLVIRNLQAVEKHVDFIKEELTNKSYVEVASLNDRMPASSSVTVTSVEAEPDQEVWMQCFPGDEDLLRCLGFRLLEGREFSADLATDTSAVILTEAAVTALGLENPIGKTLNNGNYRVVGVTADFNYQSLKNSIEPAMLTLKKDNNHNLSIKFQSSESQRLIAEIESLWATLGVDSAPDYYFLDENFAAMVEKEKVLSKAIIVFTILAMFISCLGLYGLSIFVAQRRTKEIGIRKVLGATVTSITRLLSIRFTLPILISLVASIPVSYLAATRWLAEYEYRIDISPIPFVLAGGLTIALGLITISWQTISAARRNPVETLKTE